MSEDDDIVLGRPGHEPGDAGTPLWYENQRKAMEEMNAGLADQLRAKRATPMSEAQPETVAGRQLDAEFGVGQFGRVTRLVLKAEAEARAAGAARYEAALRQIAEPKEVAGECIWCMTDFGHAADPDCPVTVASRALAAAPLAEQGDGLDVERLARALRAQHDAFLKEPESFDTARQVAEAIAAEYARLTPSRPAEERKKGDEWRDGVHLPSMADPSDD